MAKPTDVVWPRARHTEAKHQLLSGYLDAWVGILGSWARHVLLVDGFAGPGEYEHSEPGSPILMLDAVLNRPDLAKLKPIFHFLFIEENQARCEHLRTLVAARKPPGRSVDVQIVCDDFANAFPAKLVEYRQLLGKVPPTFAFIDPFGAGDDAAELASNLVSLPRCEALVYVPITMLARFVKEPDMEATLNRLYDGQSWLPARDFPDVSSRKQLLQDAFIERLKSSCDHVRPFEVEPKDGKNSYVPFFGTNERLGLQRMKASMWKIDPAGGAKFRDSSIVDHPVLFELGPDLDRLESELHAAFGTAEFSIEAAADFTLFNTAFRDDGHLKPALKAAEKAGRLVPVSVKPNRRAGQYPPKTVVRFV